MPPLRGVLFDLDDTLNDRARSWMQFADLIAHPVHGQLRPCAIQEIHELILAADRGGYRPRKELFAELAERLPWKEQPTAEQIERFWREAFPGCMVLRESVVELLVWMRTKKLLLGIVTNGSREMQSAKIRELGLERLVDAIVISGEIGVKKPHPRIFEAALHTLGTSAAETVFVGDDPKRDIVGAAGAGMRTVWISMGRNWPNQILRPDYTVTGFAPFEKMALPLMAGEPLE